MRVRGALLALLMTTSAAFAQQDQTQSLADIRQELTVLFVELRKLNQELNTTGAAGTSGLPSSTLDRVAAIESELQRLTAKTEELEYRIGRIVADGTNRIGDLEFRLCELETGCDIGALGETPTLGGDTQTTAPPAPKPQTEVSGPQLAVSEEADFKRAQEALANGDFRSAADQFTTFNQTYPGGPLAAAAELARGEALAGLGDTREAARAYLAAFSSDQTAKTAPVALFKLGEALGQLGQTSEACVTLGEVNKRYPEAQDAGLMAQSAMRQIGCS